MLCEMLFSDDGLSREARLEGVFRLVFPQMPSAEDLDEAYDFVMWFYLCGKSPETSGGGSGSSEQAFSYEHDDGYIYASFLAQYRIDLRTAKLHWWEFKALFRSLEKERRFTEIAGFRTMDISSKLSPELRNYYTKMKEQYALPIPESDRQELDELTKALLNGGDISKYI